ncbi:hypothetical protein Poly24_21150 [Rosistilla carotiformis]|uniref:DUF8091 domain-containing protein n=2 Tax=Rosistilla carotiformis TaxID=2528017 RepID=A0A518JS92_9BACT|nr:hypothetical protein Poly24_21150 [Rosistilla carotiformis]
METSLHRSLKGMYAASEADTEVRLGSYRIDAIRGDELIEIQFASLSSIRPKIQSLLRRHDVRVVKPIVFRTRIVRQATADGPVLGRRLSPKRGALIDVFAELMYFTRLFPHPRLTIEVPMVNVQHWRLPPDRRKRRRYGKDYKTKDYVLESIESTHEFRTTKDLLRLIGSDQLPHPFDTSDLAGHIECGRGTAQQIAYCLRKTGAVDACGKRGNAILYRAA